jgi:hypothetical protein
MTARSFHDLDLGDELGPARDCVGPERVRRFLTVRGSYRLDGRFTNLEAAQALGLPRLLVPGPLLAGIVDRTLRGWLPTGRLIKLDLVFRRNLWQDVPFDIHAVVVDVEERADGPSVDLDLTLIDENGDRCVTGMATVVFPSDP